MLATLVRSMKQALRPAPSGRQQARIRASAGYTVLPADHVPAPDLDGWHENAVAQRQEAAFEPHLAAMYAGRPREDFRSAADAVAATGLADPTLLEVGCGSGYYSEVLAHLRGRPVRYTGLDYSAAMIRLARQRYPWSPFQVGDATRLPFADAAFDVVFNGVALMHIPDYAAAIREARRVARAWCIFHTVPVLQRRATTLVSKLAYGRPATEVIFNRGELGALLRDAGLTVRAELPGIDYDLHAVLGEPTATRTLLCEVARMIRVLRHALGRLYWPARAALARGLATALCPVWVARRRLRQAVQRQAGRGRGWLLDIGCGGRPYQKLFAGVERYIGVDLPPNRRADVHADALALPFADRAFDTVLCNEVLEHVPQPQRLLAEAARVLKPGGVLILTTPQVWGLHHEPYDFYRYTKYGLRHLAQTAGLEVLEVSPTCGLCATLSQRFADAVTYRPRPRSAGLALLLGALVQPVLALGFGLDTLAGRRGDTLDNILVARKADAAAGTNDNSGGGGGGDTRQEESYARAA